MRVLLIALLSGLVFLLILPLSYLLLGLDPGGASSGDMALPTLRQMMAPLLTFALVGLLARSMWRLMSR